MTRNEIINLAWDMAKYNIGLHGVKKAECQAEDDDIGYNLHKKAYEESRRQAEELKNLFVADDCEFK